MVDVKKIKTKDWIDMKAVTFKPQKYYLWNPQKDITAYELALCLDIFLNIIFGGWGREAERLVSDLPDKARRHFKEVED